MLESNESLAQKIKQCIESSSFVYIDPWPDKRFQKCLKHPVVRAELAKQTSKSLPK